MAVKRFRIELRLTDYLRVRIATDRDDDGRGPAVVTDFTVQYEAVIAGKIYPVVRYDCAHGDAHRDLLDHEGHNVGEKFWLPGWSRAVALNYAITDLKAHWSQYKADFIGRMP